MCGGGREGYKKATSPQEANAPAPGSFRQCAGKCLGIFFFVPDPTEALETLTERGSPTSGNSLFPPAYARNLGNRTLLASGDTAGPSSSSCLGISLGSPRVTGEMLRALREKVALTETFPNRLPRVLVVFPFESLNHISPKPAKL